MKRHSTARFREPDSIPRLAFTLVELMVSMVVLICMVLMLGHMLSQTEKVWSQTEANKERMQNARALTDFIARELKAALLPTDRLDKRSLQFVLNPSTISAAYRNRDALFWQAPVATERGLGDVAEVGYFVKWDTTNPQNPKSQLCRFFVNPGQPASGAPQTIEPDPDYLIYTAPNGWLSDGILESAAPSSGGGYEGLFAENVVGLWVKCLYYDGLPITKNRDGVAFSNADFDSRQGYKPPDGSDNQRYSATGVIEDCMLPAAVDIGLVLLDTASAAKVRAEEKDAIGELLTGANDAPLFVDHALKEERLKAIRSGLRSWQTRVYLQNCR